MKEPGQTLDELLRRLRGAVSTQLGSPLPNWAVIKASEERLRLLSSLRSQFPQRQRRWLLPVIVALGSSCLVAVASFVHPYAPRIQLDASALAVTVELGQQEQQVAGALRFHKGTVSAGGGTLLTGKGLDTVRRAVAADALFLAPSTAIRLTADDNRCHEILVRRGTLTAQLTLTPHSPTESDGVDADQLVLPKGSHLRFCLSASSVLHLGPIISMRISTEVGDPTPPAMEIPSIRKGTLRILDTASAISLEAIDRLLLSGISDSTGAIELGDAQRIWFTGRVAQPRVAQMLGSEIEFSTDLTPSLLDLARSSPILTKLFAAITGLTTLLLGIKKWVSADK